MSYQVLPQKYRPQDFEDVIGQESVTRTLKNSILNGRIANAYIFCGPRGIGKTSIARLLSKTLNCEQSPGKSPCNKCDSCREITRGNNIDVLEIDGASNNSVDEVRALRENVKFSPSKGKYKIYIIDEVHMLSTGAFNALLKTLEEPPAHVKFIFATTEPHKVLPTIMSRCQRFDFKRIPPKMILDRILDISKKENINIDEKAAILIARSAEGSLRDGLVILDQMVSFSGKKIITDDVIELLGMVHKDKIFELSDAIIENDPMKVAGSLDEMMNSGKDPVFIANSLIGHYRDLMILKTVGEPTSDMAFSDDELTRMKTQSERLSLEELLYILQNLTHCLTLLKGAVFARAPLEVTLIKLTKRGSILSLPEILERLESAAGNNANTTNNNKLESPGLAGGSINEEPSSFKKKPEIKETPTVNVTAGDIDENGTNGTEFNTSPAAWKSILNYVRSKKMSVFTFLSSAKPIALSNKKVVIGFDNDHAFNKEVLETKGNVEVVEEAIEKVTGNSVKVEFTILDFLGDSPEKKEEVVQKKAESREKMKPILEKAMDVFGGNVIRDIMEDQI